MGSHKLKHSHIHTQFRTQSKSTVCIVVFAHAYRVVVPLLLVLSILLCHDISWFAYADGDMLLHHGRRGCSDSSSHRIWPNTDTVHIKMGCCCPDDCTLSHTLGGKHSWQPEPGLPCCVLVSPSLPRSLAPSLAPSLLPSLSLF